MARACRSRDTTSRCSAGSAVVAVLVAAAVFGWSSRRWSWEGLGLGALAWWLAAAAATSLGMPGASYAFVWPLLAILVGQAVAFLVPRGGPARSSPRGWAPSRCWSCSS